MAYEVTTMVNIVAQNEVSTEDENRVLESYDANNLEEVANSMEDDIAAMIAQDLFANADEIPILDVTSEVNEK